MDTHNIITGLLCRDVLLLLYISGIFAVGFSPIVRWIERQRVLAAVADEEVPALAVAEGRDVARGLALERLHLRLRADVIVVFDPEIHRRATNEWPKDAAFRIDRRWVCAERPFIVAAGELTLQALELERYRQVEVKGYSVVRSQRAPSCS